MSALDGPGAIRIGVDIDEAGRVASVFVNSSRPAGLARIFPGRPAREIPALAAQLFSLCGFSHGAAARLAVAAARGEALDAAAQFSVVVGLAAEQASESLRSTALGWPRAGESADMAGAAAPLREAMSAARLIMAIAARGEALSRRGELIAPAKAIAAAAALLGLRSEAPDGLAPGSFFAAIMAEARADAFVSPQVPDALQQADDAAVTEALQKGRDRFAASPTLPHRIIETGAFARHWPEAAKEESAIGARLAARFIAIGEALEIMRRALAHGEADAFGFATLSNLGAGQGFAAVETARGRLYHWLRLDADERVSDYALLAPTEWNFHPAGPFAAALLGANIGSGSAARLRVRRLAAVFDPCVAFHVELREPAHA
jgi:uptake hydrogenase large subunit